MKVEVIKSEKENLEIKVDSVTVAEILRVYLNEQGVKFAAWRKEHPTKPIVFKIQTSGKTSKKAISEAVSAIKKDAAKISTVLKK
jgi:DNA-directed RNA polymerase subunit L|tara:strand:- start:213 stop:467 length:255 start_codon:yes stop_codon:yes gene_type:complete